MRILRPVVSPSAGTMPMLDPKITRGGVVRSQVVRDQSLRQEAIFLQEFAHQFQRWCTTFAFQPWHSAVEFKRYLVRFAHMVAGFDRLQGIMRTVYNQYDSMVRPLQKWLDERGVRFELNTRVTDLALREQDGELIVTQIAYQRDGRASEIAVGAHDYVLVTLGSMTKACSLGAMDTAPVLNGKEDGGAWML